MGMVWVARLASANELQHLMQHPDSIYDFVNSEEGYDGGSAIDLDKQWHAVHFLLTKSAGATNHPLSLIIGDFTELGPDHGYGAAWVIPADFIRGFHDALSALGDEEIQASYDPEAMLREDVYIADMLAEEGEEALEFIMQDVKRLREFAATGAAGSFSALGLIT